VPGGAADRGRVVGQTPTMGAPLALRGRLTLSFVPDPALPPTSSVPPVTQMPPADAIQAVASAGLHARVAKVTLAGVPEGLVVGQVPTPGTEMPRYGTVVVVVSAASEAGGRRVGTAVVAVQACSASRSRPRAALGANLDRGHGWTRRPTRSSSVRRCEAGASARRVPR
jgi:hypothetical protein